MPDIDARIEKLSDSTPYVEFFEFMNTLMARKDAHYYEDVVEFVRDRLSERIADEAESGFRDV